MTMPLGSTRRTVVAIRPLDEVRLTTARLALRPLTSADAPALQRHLSDHQVSRWLARVPYPYGLADAFAFVDHVRLAAIAGSAVTLGVTRRAAGDDVVGVVALHGLDGLPEFGYWLGRAHWGQGLMTEAAGALLAHAYGTLPIDEIVSGAFAGNDASLAIQARYGFVHEGRSRRQCLARGGLVDHVDTRLDRAGFRPPPAG
ncbi:GNAT family N-acetyltransferase [Oharaeibacter diazotrophicus]|uniref:RimJ/RimL family protein N-acetyltransferase n=1 Tax=Oharaeibacter diazotrophicus TaxID=1920512 RepID=A0A4R6R8F9_9HYPH|nr:GNAT family N-acetyltransferase [Oharaeibacter diazotrophicus]TDP81867.1 RimJ/RimL family protein N-acetyltransferase [Oharaeibacter diazotrophicus]BBE73499.1 putative ribosomal N-acetyltransferase YdaF [Pleomorphomonas sp. SM30]GLS75288.1 N-acetyltransferase [Oharaeibacter diazotrophicus]